MKMLGRWARQGFILGAAVALIGASAAHAEPIEDALAKAYASNPQLLAGRANLRSTDEEVPQALANWRPSVEVTASIGREVANSSTSAETDRHQSRDPKSMAITLTQPLFRGGRTLATTSQAENQVRAQRARLLDTEQTVLLDAATAYLNVFRDKAVLELNRNQEQVLKRQLEATRDRFAVGEITRTDVHQAEARLSRATADRIQAEGTLESSRAQYLNVVGEAAGDSLSLPKLAWNLPANKEDAIRLGVINNPGVIAAEFDRKAALDNIDAVWGELLPTLEFEASASRDIQTTTEKNLLTTYSAVLNLTVPIYQQGAVYSRLRQARQDAAEQSQVIDRERRTAAEEATRAYEDMVTARARVDSFKAQIDANIVALEGVEREAAVGSRTVLDVLDAEQELLDSRVGHVRAQRDELVAMFQLRSAVGLLTARDLGLGGDLYDPRQHYDEVRNKWFGGRSTGGVK